MMIINLLVIISSSSIACDGSVIEAATAETTALSVIRSNSSLIETKENNTRYRKNRRRTATDQYYNVSSLIYNYESNTQYLNEFDISLELLKEDSRFRFLDEYDDTQGSEIDVYVLNGYNLVRFFKADATYMSTDVYEIGSLDIINTIDTESTIRFSLRNNLEDNEYDEDDLLEFYYDPNYIDTLTVERTGSGSFLEWYQSSEDISVNIDLIYENTYTRPNEEFTVNVAVNYQALLPGDCDKNLTSISRGCTAYYPLSFEPDDNILYGNGIYVITRVFDVNYNEDGSIETMQTAEKIKGLFSIVCPGDLEFGDQCEEEQNISLSLLFGYIFCGLSFVFTIFVSCTDIPTRLAEKGRHNITDRLTAYNRELSLKFSIPKEKIQDNKTKSDPTKKYAEKGSSMTLLCTVLTMLILLLIKGTSAVLSSLVLGSTYFLGAYMIDMCMLFANVVLILRSMRSILPSHSFDPKIHLHKIVDAVRVSIPSLGINLDMIPIRFLDIIQWFTDKIDNISFATLAEDMQVTCVGAKAGGYVFSNILLIVFLYLVLEVRFLEVIRVSLNGLTRDIIDYLNNKSKVYGRISKMILPNVVKGLEFLIKYTVQLLYGLLTMRMFIAGEDYRFPSTKVCDTESGNQDTRIALIGTFIFWIAFFPLMHISLKAFVPGTPKGIVIEPRINIKIQNMKFLENFWDDKIQILENEKSNHIPNENAKKEKKYLKNIDGKIKNYSQKKIKASKIKIELQQKRKLQMQQINPDQESMYDKFQKIKYDIPDGKKYFHSCLYPLFGFISKSEKKVMTTMIKNTQVSPMLDIPTDEENDTDLKKSIKSPTSKELKIFQAERIIPAPWPSKKTIFNLLRDVSQLNNEDAIDKDGSPVIRWSSFAVLSEILDEYHDNLIIEEEHSKMVELMISRNFVGSVHSAYQESGDIIKDLFFGCCNTESFDDVGEPTCDYEEFKHFVEIMCPEKDVPSFIELLALIIANPKRTINSYFSIMFWKFVQILKITCGVWDEEAIDAFDVAERTEEYDNNPDDGLSAYSESLSAIGQLKTIFWQIFPGTIIIAKFGEAINYSPIYISESATYEKLIISNIHRSETVVDSKDNLAKKQYNYDRKPILHNVFPFTPKEFVLSFKLEARRSMEFSDECEKNKVSFFKRFLAVRFFECFSKVLLFLTMIATIASISTTWIQIYFLFTAPIRILKSFSFVFQILDFDNIQGIYESLITLISDFSFKESLPDINTETLSKIPDIEMSNNMQNATEGFSKNMQNANEGLSNNMQNAMNNMQNATEGFSNNMQNATEGFSNNMQNANEGLSNNMQNATEGFSNNMQNATENIQSIAKDNMYKITNT